MMISIPRRLLTSCIALSSIVSAIAAGVEKPNIVVILADDLGWAELGCYGQKKIKTPNLDRLASQGQRWTQFYSGAPVCAPSRNVMLTGRHTGGCNVQDLLRVDYSETWEQLKGDWPMKAELTLPSALKKAGYSTAAFGKWGMGEYGTSGAPDRNGVDYFYGYTDHRLCHTFYPPFLWRNGVKDVINHPGIPGHSKIPEGPVTDDALTGEKHASVAITDELLSYVDRHAGDKEPFFIYYCPLEPHVAMQPPREWVDRYPAGWDTGPYRGERSYQPHPRPRAGYAAMISFMDDNVGRLLVKLKEKGLEDNTLVIFTSDNGTTHDVGGVDHGFFNSVSKLRGLKGSCHEGGIRVPGIVRWPGKIAAGKVIDQPAYSADIMPTLCALTGADPGKPYGENLLPVLLGKTDRLAQRRPLVWTGGGYGGQVAVRLGDMKAIRKNLSPGIKQGPFDWEVYDLSKDPSEATDLSASRRDAITAAVSVIKKEYTRDPAFPELQINAPESGRKDSAAMPNPVSRPESAAPANP
jgi:arylsulfatase A-like enzyme